jgi:tetratricopeptide (TPR) repeat protein
MTCKEHTAVLPAALLLTDYFFNPGLSFSGIRRNWKLYLPVGILGSGALLYFATHITSKSNLGFSLRDLTWYEYLFTQFRAIFIYLRLFVLPYGQSVDYNFPISHTLMEHGSLFYGLALLSLAACAMYFRKRFPLTCYGFLLTLLLLAPTSSFMPIRDPLVERRLYLPFIGLLLIACDLALRIPIPRKALAWSAFAVCLLFAILAFERNAVWMNMDSLWRDAYSKSPDNPRALMGLADAYALGGRCAEAIPYFEKAAKLQPGDYKAVFNLASAYDCAGNLPASRAGYEAAIRIKPSAEGWDHLAMIQMKSNQPDAAMESLANAQRLDRDYLLTYTYRGILLLAQSRFYEAEAQFRNVLANIPADELALRGVDRAQKHVRQF